MLFKKKIQGQVHITRDQLKRMKELRQLQLAHIALTDQQEGELSQLESLYVGAKVVPALRDYVKPAMEGFGGHLRACIEIDEEGEVHYMSWCPNKPAPPVRHRTTN